jgi:hypothetical protein
MEPFANKRCQQILTMAAGKRELVYQYPSQIGE